jgi:anti-sigma B factor antagonist
MSPTVRDGSGGGGGGGGAWIQVSPRSDCVVVTVGGEVDLLFAGKLAMALQTATAASHAGCLILDMTHLDFIDSSGLGVLIAASNRAEALGDTFALVHPPPLVQRLLSGAQLTHRFPAYDTLDAALAALRAL